MCLKTSRSFLLVCLLCNLPIQGFFFHGGVSSRKICLPLFIRVDEMTTRLKNIETSIYNHSIALHIEDLKRDEAIVAQTNRGNRKLNARQYVSQLLHKQEEESAIIGATLLAGIISYFCSEGDLFIIALSTIAANIMAGRSDIIGIVARICGSVADFSLRDFLRRGLTGFVSLLSVANSNRTLSSRASLDNILTGRGNKRQEMAYNSSSYSQQQLQVKPSNTEQYSTNTKRQRRNDSEISYDGKSNYKFFDDVTLAKKNKYSNSTTNAAVVASTGSDPKPDYSWPQGFFSAAEIADSKGILRLTYPSSYSGKIETPLRLSEMTEMDIQKQASDNIVEVSRAVTLAPLVNFEAAGLTDVQIRTTAAGTVSLKSELDELSTMPALAQSPTPEILDAFRTSNSSSNSENDLGGAAITTTARNSSKTVDDDDDVVPRALSAVELASMAMRGAEEAIKRIEVAMVQAEQVYASLMGSGAPAASGAPNSSNDTRVSATSLSLNPSAAAAVAKAGVNGAASTMSESASVAKVTEKPKQSLSMALRSAIFVTKTSEDLASQAGKFKANSDQTSSAILKKVSGLTLNGLASEAIASSADYNYDVYSDVDYPVACYAAPSGAALVSSLMQSRGSIDKSAELGGYSKSSSDETARVYAPSLNDEYPVVRGSRSSGVDAGVGAEIISANADLNDDTRLIITDVASGGNDSEGETDPALNFNAWRKWGSDIQWDKMRFTDSDLYSTLQQEAAAKRGLIDMPIKPYPMGMKKLSEASLGENAGGRVSAKVSTASSGKSIVDRASMDDDNDNELPIAMPSSSSFQVRSTINTSPQNTIKAPPTRTQSLLGWDQFASPRQAMGSGSAEVESSTRTTPIAGRLTGITENRVNVDRNIFEDDNLPVPATDSYPSAIAVPLQQPSLSIASGNKVYAPQKPLSSLTLDGGDDYNMYDNYPVPIALGATTQQQQQQRRTMGSEPPPLLVGAEAESSQSIVDEVNNPIRRDIVDGTTLSDEALLEYARRQGKTMYNIKLKPKSGASKRVALAEGNRGSSLVRSARLSADKLWVEDVINRLAETERALSQRR